VALLHFPQARTLFASFREWPSHPFAGGSSRLAARRQVAA
jgi:hypothetical protein